MDDVSCTGSESSITSCTYISNHNCVHGEDVGVICARKYIIIIVSLFLFCLSVACKKVTE